MPRPSRPPVGWVTWLAAVTVGLSATFGTVYVMVVLAFWSDSGDHPQTAYLLAAQVFLDLCALVLVIGAVTFRWSSWLRSNLTMVAAIVMALIAPLVALPSAIR